MDGRICAPLFTGIDRIWELINGKNGNNSIQSGAYIFSIPSFNEAVIRESVLNAIAHRDYTIGSEIVIKQYPKMIIINNPGGFPKGVTLDNLVTVSSTPRSRLMAEVLEKTGLVERSGQGIDKIFSITLSEGKSLPDYQNSDLYQITLKLRGEITGKAFHVYVNQLQSNRTEGNKLSVEDIIGLYRVKEGLFTLVKETTLTRLERERLISRGSNNSSRYTLSDPYSALAEIEQRIGNRYVVADVDQFLMAIQGQSLKIGDLEDKLKDSMNRNQVKYLITKLSEDHILTPEGAGKGTRYKLTPDFSPFRGDRLVADVLDTLRSIHARV